VESRSASYVFSTTPKRTTDSRSLVPSAAGAVPASHQPSGEKLAGTNRRPSGGGGSGGKPLAVRGQVLGPEISRSGEDDPARSGDHPSHGVEVEALDQGHPGPESKQHATTVRRRRSIQGLRGRDEDRTGGGVFFQR
jgi:hypothetical protein